MKSDRFTQPLRAKSKRSPDYFGARAGFIVIDGPDGCGKSTQIKLLARYLQQRNKKILVVRDPGSTTISEGIRKILLNPRYKEMTPLTELFLYFASRAQLVDQIIRPALKKNITVICDRFLSSTIVYQGYAGHIGADKIRKIWAEVSGNFIPDVTIILDVPPEKGFERIRNSRASHDRMEQKALLFHKKVRQGFIKLVQSDKRKYRLIDGTRSIEEIQAMIRKIIKA
ncbi:MAG: dTMP kinase [Planctomycetes bacterium]|nr:dTMP kinase [Planctomycetota bacterium]